MNHDDIKIWEYYVARILDRVVKVRVLSKDSWRFRWDDVTLEYNTTDSVSSGIVKWCKTVGSGDVLMSRDDYENK